jgi:hypothetical protein
MKAIGFILSLMFVLNAFAQKNIFLNIEPKFGNQSFVLNQTYIGNDGVAVEIQDFNYYLSDVSIFHDNGQQTDLSNDIWLVTSTQHSLYLGYLGIDQLDSICFTIGVPKRYNTQSGSLAQDISTYPETHPLSFQSPSMYWGWAFGYMHMIVGGKADNNNNGIPNAYFELHNLGNNNQQTVTLPLIQTNIGSQIDLSINCHLDRWLNQMPLSSVGVLHGETGLNQNVMQNILTQDVFTLDAAAQTVSHQINPFTWMQSANEVTVFCDQNEVIDHFKVYANTGQLLLEGAPFLSTAIIPLDHFNSGVYLFQIETSKGPYPAFRIIKP